MRLCSCVGGVEVVGRIVEVEAYGPVGDEASHAARGPTKRTQVMFREAGCCYVYFIYGNHFCVNVVTEKQGLGAAVLIRALEPLRGVQEMQARRRIDGLFGLSNGPGKLCEALGIDAKLNGEDLITSERIWLSPGRRRLSERVVDSPRIGITKATHLPWRLYLSPNPHVSQRNRDVAAVHLT